MSYASRLRGLWSKAVILPITLGSMGACSAAASSSKSSFAGAAGTDITAAMTRLAAHAWSSEDVARIASLSISRYYGSLLAETSDTPFVFNGQSVGNAHTALAAAAPTFAMLYQRYGTLGSLLAAQEDVMAPDAANLDSMFGSLASDYGAKSGWFKTGAASDFAQAQLAPVDRVAADPTDAARQDQVNFAALTALAGLGPTTTLPSLGLVIDEITPNLCTTLYVWPSKRAPKPEPNPDGSRPRYNPFTDTHAAVKATDVNGQTADVGGVDYFVRAFGPPAKVIKMPQMTTNQLSNLVSKTGGKLRGGEFLKGGSYDWLTNNCAQNAANTLVGMGYDLPLDPNKWGLMPTAVATAANSYIADQEDD